MSDTHKSDARTTPALTGSLPMLLNMKQMEKISKALGDGNRLKILHFISKEGGCGECSNLPEVVDLAQPSISHHVKILVEAGLIEQVKQGRNCKYTLNGTLLDGYIGMLKELKTS
jgi:ArsR family transcriptional regulator